MTFIALEPRSLGCLCCCCLSHLYHSRLCSIVQSCLRFCCFELWDTFPYHVPLYCVDLRLNYIQTSKVSHILTFIFQDISSSSLFIKYSKESRRKNYYGQWKSMAGHYFLYMHDAIMQGKEIIGCHYKKVRVFSLTPKGDLFYYDESIGNFASLIII